MKSIISKFKTMGDTQSKHRPTAQQEATQRAGPKHEHIARGTSNKQRNKQLQNRLNTLEISSPPFKNVSQENRDDDGFKEGTNEPPGCVAPFSQARHDKLPEKIENEISDLNYHTPIGKKQNKSKSKSKAKALKKNEKRQAVANKKTKTPKKRTSFFKRAFHFRIKTRNSLNRANMDIVPVEEEQGQAHVGVDKAPWNSKQRVILSPRNANCTAGGENQERQIQIGSFWGDDRPSPEPCGPYGNRKPKDRVSYGIAPHPRMSIGTRQKRDNGLRMDHIITATSSLSTNFTRDGGRVVSTPKGGPILGSRSAISVLFEGDERSVSSNGTPIPPETPTDHDYLAEYDQDEQRQLMQAPSDDTSCASEASSRCGTTTRRDSFQSNSSHNGILAKYLLTQRNNPEQSALGGASGPSAIEFAPSCGSTCSSLPASWARPSTAFSRERLSYPFENTNKHVTKMGIDCNLLSPIAKCDSIRECESESEEYDQSLFSIADSATKPIVAASLCKGSFGEAVADMSVVTMDTHINVVALKVEEKEIAKQAPLASITPRKDPELRQEDETKTGGPDYSPRAFAPKGSAFGVRLKHVKTPAGIVTNVRSIGDGVFPGSSVATDEEKKEMSNHLPLSSVTSPPAPTNARSPINAFSIFPEEEDNAIDGRDINTFSKRLSFNKLKKVSPVKKNPVAKYAPPKTTKGLVAQRVNLFNEIGSETLHNGRLRRNRVVNIKENRRDTVGEGVLAPRQPKLESPLFPKKRPMTQENKASSVVSIGTKLAESRKVVSNREVLASLQEDEEEAEEEAEAEHEHGTQSVLSANIRGEVSANIVDSAKSIEDNAETDSNDSELKPDAASVAVAVAVGPLRSAKSENVSVSKAEEKVDELAAIDESVNDVEEGKSEVPHSQSADSMESKHRVNELSEQMDKLQMGQERNEMAHQEDEILDDQENHHLPDEEDAATDYDISSSFQESSSASEDDFALELPKIGSRNNELLLSNNSYGEEDSFYDDEQVIVGSSSGSPFSQLNQGDQVDSDEEESYGGQQHDAISNLGAPSLGTPRQQMFGSVSVSPMQETPKALRERTTGTQKPARSTTGNAASMSPLNSRRGNSSMSVLSAYQKDSGKAIFTPPPSRVEKDVGDKENSPFMVQMQAQSANSPFASPLMTMKVGSKIVNPGQMNTRGKPVESLCLSPTQRTPAQANKWRQKAAKYSAANGSTKKKRVTKIGKGRLSIDVRLTGL
jgi:hypothetical protein